MQALRGIFASLVVGLNTLAFSLILVPVGKTLMKSVMTIFGMHDATHMVEIWYVRKDIHREEFTLMHFWPGN